MTLLPKSSSAWTRSLAHSLFAGSMVVWLVVFWGGLGFTHNEVWHYAGASIGGLLLPLLGVALGLICFFGKGLDKSFRKLALLVAVLSVLQCLLSVPALAR